MDLWQANSYSKTTKGDPHSPHVIGLKSMQKSSLVDRELCSVGKKYPKFQLFLLTFQTTQFS